MNCVELGDIAKDKITGVEGVVVAITDWLYACKRVTLQPQNLGKDGQPLDNYTVDEPQVEVVEKAGFKVSAEDVEDAPEKNKSNKTGGPSIRPVDRGGPF